MVQLQKYKYKKTILENILDVCVYLVSLTCAQVKVSLPHNKNALLQVKAQH